LSEEAKELQTQLNGLKIQLENAQTEYERLEVELRRLKGLVQDLKTELNSSEEERIQKQVKTFKQNIYFLARN
jgi:regulator of replication initiation timing